MSESNISPTPAALAGANQGYGLFLVGGVVKEIVKPSEPQLLRDHLSSLLQVHNLVVLLGSGASFHLGSPQTRNLTNEQVEELVVRAGNEISADDSDLLRTINPQDSGDLEQLLNGVQLAAALAHQAGHSNVVLGAGSEAHSFGAEAVSSLRRKINRALATACHLPGDVSKLASPFDLDPFRAHRTFLARMLRGRRSNLPRPRIFTTNYDLVIERALDQLGYPYIDGFSGSIDRRLNLAYYGLDFHRVETTSQSMVERAEGAAYLHKIHGSLNWRSMVERDPATNLESLEVRQVAEGDAGNDDDLVLIYPTASKEGDTLAYPYSDLLRLLGDAVQQPDTAVIVAGYGFADAHINRLLLRSLATNPALNLFVADPKAVFADDDLSTLVADTEIIGRSLHTVGVDMRTTAIAALASNVDARVAVLTGDPARFTDLAELMPDSGTQVNLASPSAVASLIDALDRASRGDTASVPQGHSL